jgi:hypothetical protein
MRADARLLRLEEAFFSRRARALSDGERLDARRLFYRLERGGWNALGPEFQGWAKVLLTRLWGEIE